jgi:predicted phosphodiesterase
VKYAIISDIHSNLEALNTVIKFLQSQKINKIICLGDIVGYGPHPNECITIIKNECDVCIMGNHDHAVLGLTDISYFNQFAKESVLWTREQLTDESRSFLTNLSFTFETENTLFVHSTPVEPEEWNYILSTQEANIYLEKINFRLVFIGHSHVPVVFSSGHGPVFEKSMILDLEKEKYIVNVGSVGQPRNKDPRSCFVLYNDEQNTIEYVLLDYDIKKTYQDIIEKRLPPFLATRLLSGF